MKKISKILCSLLLAFSNFGFSNVQYQEETTGEETETTNVETVSEDNTSSEVTIEEVPSETEDPPEAIVFEEIDESATNEEITEENFILGNVDFSSLRLIVAGDVNTIREDDPVISEYNGIYLIQFESLEETRDAYQYYYRYADFVEPDITFIASEEPEESDIEPLTEPMTEDENPIAELEKEKENGIEEYGDPHDSKHMVIAVIDTGINADDLLTSVSMLGDDVKDDNGHGTNMYNAIRSINENVDIISIKVLDSDGKGTASSILAGIEYARQAKVDIINLSLSALGTSENSVVADAIHQAIDDGITVIGSAGNNGRNAAFYIPAAIEEAIIIGAGNENGEYATNSNRGNTVDFLVKAESTSEATALYTGMFSYAYMNMINIASAFPTKIMQSPEKYEEFQNKNIPDDGMFHATEVASNVIDLSAISSTVSRALVMYEGYDIENDMVYAYNGLGQYLGSNKMYVITEGGIGTIASYRSDSTTKTLRFWMPRVGTWHGRSVGAEVKFEDILSTLGEQSNTQINNDPFLIDIRETNASAGVPTSGKYGNEYGAFNILAKNSHQMRITTTFYENVDVTEHDTNGDKITFNSDAEHLLYGAIGLSNESLINGTYEWTAPPDAATRVYAFSNEHEPANTWVKEYFETTGHPSRTTAYPMNVYFSSLTEYVPSGLQTKWNADFLYDALGKDDLVLYAGFTGLGSQHEDPDYASGTFGDPTMWFRLSFASWESQPLTGKMYTLEIDPNGGIYQDLTGEGRAYQEADKTADTDDWYIDDVSSQADSHIIDGKLYDGVDGISIPTKENYSFGGWDIMYGEGDLNTAQDTYSFGNSNGGIKAKWRNYLIETVAVNGTITSDNQGAMAQAGAVTDILPSENRTIQYANNRYYHITKVEVYERDNQKIDEDDPYDVKWETTPTSIDIIDHKTSYEFANINNDYKIVVTYEPSYLTVNYLEQGTNTVMWQQKNEFTDGKGSEYSVISPEIRGYTLIEEGESQKVVEGIMPDDTYEVNVYYDKTPMVGGLLTVEKTASPFQGTVVSPGNTITYTLTAKNTGIENSGQITIQENIPVGTTFVEASDAPVQQENLLTWTLDGLDRNATKSVTFTVMVNDGFNSPVYNSAYYKVAGEETWHETDLMIHPTDASVVGPAALQSTKSASRIITTTTTTSGSGSQQTPHFGNRSTYGDTTHTISFTAPGKGTYTFELYGGATVGWGTTRGTGGGYLKASIELNGGEAIRITTGSQGGWVGCWGSDESHYENAGNTTVTINGTRVMETQGGSMNGYGSRRYGTGDYYHASNVTVLSSANQNWQTTTNGPNGNKREYGTHGEAKVSYSYTNTVITYDTEDAGGIVEVDSTHDSTITYDVTLKNNGSTLSNSSVLRDAIPVGTNYVADSLSVTASSGATTKNDVYYDSATNQVVADFGDMDPFSSRTIQFKVTANGKNALIDNQVDFGRDVTGDIKTVSLKHKSNIIEYYIPGAITVNKIWLGDEGESDTRPTSLNVHLVNMSTKAVVANGTITEADGWTYTFRDSGITPGTVTYGVYEDVPDMYSCANYNANTAATVTVVNGAGFVNISNEYLATFDVSKQVFNSRNLDIDRKVVLHNDRLYYVISVTNPMASAKDFDIEDTIPANSTYVPNSANLEGSYDSTTNKVTWTNVTINPGATAEVRFNVTAVGNTSSIVKIANKATVWMKKRDGTRNTQSVSETNEVTNYVIPTAPESITTKTVTDAAGTNIDTKYVEKDKQLYYHINVKNDSDITKTFTITDTIPTNTEFVSVGQSGSYNATTGTITWVKEIAANSSVRVDFVVKVTSENCDIANKAHIAADYSEWDTNEVSNQTAKIVLNKEISNYYAPFGKPAFLFKIAGTDGSEYYRMVEINNQFNGTAEFAVPMYTASNVQYTVSELQNARYKYENLEIVSGAATKESETAVTNFSKNNRIAIIKYTNGIQQFNKMNHMSSVKNSVN